VSTRRRPPLWLCAVTLLSVGLLLTPGVSGATRSAEPRTVVAWGCGGDYGACAVPRDLAGVVTATAAGWVDSLALKMDGTVAAWGCGSGPDYGQCSVPSGLSGVTAIAAGSAHSLALKNDGTVVAWGCDGFDAGQCSVPGGLSGVTAIAAGYAHSLALKGDGSVVAWGCGFNDLGQCSVPSGLSGVTAIAASYAHSLALKSDGTVVAWGCALDSGQCSVPSGLSGVTAIAAGTYHSLAAKSDGTVVAWGCGQNNAGQCTVPSGLSGVTAVAGGDAHSLALKSDGTVVAWGCGAPADFGQCSVPSGLSRVSAIGAGPIHSLALTELTNQTITFGALPNKTWGDSDFSVGATASSGLGVSFAASGNCTVSGATVRLTSVGLCRVTASQSGNATYNPAPDVSQTFAIAKAGQSITFRPLGRKTYGGPDFRVSATASSHLLVSFAASGHCSVSGTTVHLKGAGSCRVTASQPGDEFYNAAPDVSRTFSIVPKPCRVPKVVGKRVASARRTIARRHCRTGKVRRAYSRKHKGIVISENRRPGRVLPAGSKINLVVSRGPRH
jgi:hypothetical protein